MDCRREALLRLEAMGLDLCVGLRHSERPRQVFSSLIAQFADTMVVLTDTGFYVKTGDPVNIKICPRGTWNTRMLVETVWSKRTMVFHSKKVSHRVWASFPARVAWTMVAFNLLARWGLEIDVEDMVRLAIAEFSL